MTIANPFPGWRLLALPVLLALSVLQPGQTANAQGACLVLDSENREQETAGQLSNLNCLTALSGPAELYADWSLTDTVGRPVTVTLSAALGQQVTAELLVPGRPGPAAAAVLEAADGSGTEVVWPLRHADYELRFTVTGEEGRFVFSPEGRGSRVSIGGPASGPEGRRETLRGVIDRIGSLAGNPDYLGWRLQEDDVAGPWRLQLTGTPGHPVTVKIYDEDGSELLHESAAAGETVDLIGLEFSAGDHTIVLSPVGESEHAGYWLSLSRTGVESDGSKQGRSGSHATANRISLEGGISGQLDEDSTDYFHLPVSEAEAGLYELRLETAASLSNFCIDGADRSQISCWTVDSQAFEIPLLRLDPGEYWFRINGHRQDQPDYSLTFTEAETPPADNVVWAPSGTRASAFALPESLSARFSHGGRTTTFLAFDVEDSGLYRVQLQATGDVRSLSVIDGGGNRIRSDRQLRLDNIPVRSGTNFVTVDALAGDYALRLLRLSDLPPSQEPSPAAEAATAPVDESLPEELQAPELTARPEGVVVRNTDTGGVSVTALRAGQNYTGIADSRIEQFRFTLLADTPVRVALTPPADGQMSLRLNPSPHSWIRSQEDGESVEVIRWLSAGDYAIEIQMDNDARDWYTLRLDELDPLDLPVHMQPLDVANAGTLPADLRLDIPWTLHDMHFRLPVTAEDTTLRVEVLAGEPSRLWIHPLPETRSATRLEKLDVDEETGSFSVQLEADVDYHVALLSGGDTPWNLNFDFGDAVTAVTAADPRDHLDMALELDSLTVAAWSRLGQVTDGLLTVTNRGEETVDAELTVHTSDPRALVSGLPDAISLAAGDEAVLPLELVLPDDLRSDRPMVLTLGARNSLGETATVQEQLIATCDAPHVNARVWTPDPFGGLTYWNYALPAWGTEISGEPSDRFDPLVIDGRVSVAQPRTVNDGKEYVLDLGREVSVHATALHPVGGGNAQTRLRDFELAVSTDGEEWTTVLSDSLTGAGMEQVFELAEPVRASHARLTVLSGQGRTGSISVGEWKLLGPDAPHERINLADHALGGHIVTSTVWAGMTEMLSGDTRPQASMQVDSGPFEIVLGFHENRAALISSFTWDDYELRGRNSLFVPAVTVEVSTESPLGPWEHVADWQLSGPPGEEPAEPGQFSLELDEPVWARFVRFTETGGQIAERRILNLPAPLRVFEAPSSENYRSIISEWGMDRETAAFEHLQGEAGLLASVTFGDNGSRETAAELAAETSGFVQTGSFEAWYELTVPEDMNLISLDVASSGTVVLQLEVFDQDFETVATGRSGEQLRVSAEPGVYHLRISEPPRSIAFVWDNSGSVSPFSGMIYAALDSFAAEIRPESEEVMLAVFSVDGARFLVPDWSGSADEVTRALGAYDQADGSSDTGLALLATNRQFERRDSSRALLLITDAEFNFNSTPEVWRSIEAAQVQVFTLHASSASSSVSQDYMQDLARGSGGYYAATPTHADLETGFARADCLIRRPKPYQARVAFAQQAAAPGQLVIGAATEAAEGAPEAGQAQAAGAIQVILDASGSMWQRLDDRFRYEIANDVLIDLVEEVLPAEVPFALRVFGNRQADVCRSDLEVALAPLEPGAVAQVIAGVEPQPFAGTPLAESILLAREDMAGAGEPRTLILITDGEESCDGNVEAAIEELRGEGVDVVLNIIGFDFDADDVEAARERFRSWAELGGGQYFDASDAAELADALERSVATPFEVLDEAGEVIARGTVGGPELNLDGGTYSVRILSEPVQLLENVRIDGELTELSVP